MDKVHEVIIVGSGPAGLTAAIYTARANLAPVVIAGMSFGGQLMTTTEVENYPGFAKGITGPELMSQMMEQAKRFGAEIVYKDATAANLEGDIKEITAGGTLYKAKAVIIATGATPKLLGLPSEKEYWGKGVSSCATCDGAFYRDRVVAVVGGGDSAAEEASFLTRFATKVHMIVRRDELRASKIMQDRVKNHEKIEIHWNSSVDEVLGDGKVVTSLRLKSTADDTTVDLPADGLFLAIGHTPASSVFAGVISTDDEGYITPETHTYTNINGVFVAGDVSDHRYRQAVTAAGEGCKAAIDCERYLESLA